MSEWRPIILNAVWLVPASLLAVYLLAKYVMPATFGRLLRPVEQHDVGTARTGDRFVLPTGCTIMALDEVVLQLPAELVVGDEKIGDVIQGPDGMGFAADFDETTGKTRAIFVRLSSGHTLALSKPSEAVVHAEDRTVRIRVLSRGDCWRLSP